MKNIKKFNELFDTEDLKNRHEIPFLTGELQKSLTKIDNNFRDDNIENLTSKLQYKFPFFSAYIEAANSNSGEKKFSNFKALMKNDDKNGYYYYVASNDYEFVTIGVKIISNNLYDVVAAHEDGDYERHMDEKGLSFDELCEVVRQVFIESLMGAGFTDLISYNYQNVLSRIN
jgi:hypothetical protein